MPDPVVTPASAVPTNHAARIAAAIAAIGPSDRDDYVIAPRQHADRYRTSAPELARLLSGSVFEGAADRFETFDARALEHQTNFQTMSRRARESVFWAGTATAVLLVAGGVGAAYPQFATMVILPVAGAITVVTGALAAMWIRRIREGRLLEQWMTARAKAESARLAYFERIVAAECSEPLLQLEYFRRYQLAVQRAYYRRRGDDHRREADRALGQSSLGMAAGAAASGLAGVLAVWHVGWTALAGVGLVGQAWAAKIANTEATAQNRRNAERYHRTDEALDHLAERLDEVREALALGDRDVVGQLVEAVHEQLSLEHRQWLEELDAASKAIDRLDRTLASYHEKNGVPGGGEAAAESAHQE